MIRLFTEVCAGSSSAKIGRKSRTMVLGSCFADEIGIRMIDAGFDACINPFGTLYNPESLLSSILRLDDCRHFTPDDCMEMGAGAGMTCSFSHHSSFARKDSSDFLENANNALDRASAFWKSCSHVIVTFGTALVWKYNGVTVSNCLKRPACEFSREMLTADRTAHIVKEIVRSFPDKHFMFTVSPIRHLGDGAHVNQLSKATLLLGLESALSAEDKINAEYFPSYEILLDELRDYRFFSEDLCHPSKCAVDVIWERFLDFATPASDREAIRASERESRKNRHSPILRKQPVSI